MTDTMTTRPRKAPPSRLERAQSDLEKARCVLDAVKARQLADGDVTAQELSDATHLLELCELDVQGAQEAEAHRAQLNRVTALGKIKSEHRADADADEFVACYEALALGVARLVEAVGPARSARVAARIRAVRALGVPEVVGNAPCRPEDNGMGGCHPVS
jgi:hypothetical protein